MNKEEFIGKLQMVYIGDRNAFNEIVSEYDRLKGALQTHEILLKTNVEEVDRLNNIINELENIRKEAIEYINDVTVFDGSYMVSEDLLNILNKGE